MSLRDVLLIVIGCCAFGPAMAVTAGERAANRPGQVDFAKSIKPILVQRCLSCHGPKKRESGLRLDVGKSALNGGDSGVAIRPGMPGKSLLLQRILSRDPDEQMPPKGPRLTKEQVSLISRWIAQGARWPDGGVAETTSDHWSFQRIERPTIPRLSPKQASGVRNDIDRFVRQRLAAEGLTPSPEAGPHTLLRRLHLDLTGIPPTRAEIKSFLAARQREPEQAYVTAVDRLLGSKHFGERWALEWLDLARYADSDGYEKDLPRPHAYRWRDWLIGAINADLPFDQFTEQQLAGDLIPGATNQVVLATGFHRNTLTNREGGVDQEEFRVKAVVDRVNTTFTVWMGLTVGCSECHSHKYDPITQREYYGLFGFFNNADEKDIQVAPSEAAQRQFDQDQAGHMAKMAAIEKRIADMRPALEKRMTRWVASVTSDQGTWHGLMTPKVTAASGADATVRDDGSIEISGKVGDRESLEIAGFVPKKNVGGIRLTALTSDHLPARGPGRAPDGRFVLSGISLEGSVGGERAFKGLPLTNVRDTSRIEASDANASLVSSNPRGWNPKPGDPSTAVFEVAGHSVKAGVVGNPLPGGVQDGATQVFTVYAGSPIPAVGRIDKLRFWSQAKRGSKCGFYLLRPDTEGSYRVIEKYDITSEGVGGQVVELALPQPWHVQRGDLLANSSNGGPGYRVGPSTDLVFYPVKSFPQARQTVSLNKLTRYRESRMYFLQAEFAPAVSVTDEQARKAGAPVTRIRITLGFADGRSSLGRFRVEWTESDDPLGLKRKSMIPGDVLQIASTAQDKRTKQQSARLLEYYSTIDKTLTPLRKQLSELKKKAPKLATSTAHVMTRRPTPRATHVHRRGNFLDRGPRVDVHTPAFLPELTARGETPDRLDLARWIMSPKNPLTARVAANGIWRRLFGRGLVVTNEDFGTQGEPPTHPQLLDWLATEYRGLGWSRKRMIKRIVMSATYRQSSVRRADQESVDPQNSWLSRQNRFRLSGELIRDQYLAAAGILNPQVGGRSFRPPLPPGAKAIQFVNKWAEDSGDELRRRGLYIHLQRNLMLPMLMTFDRPDGIVSCTRRERSNTPLQALTLLNGRVFVDAARQLGVELSASNGATSQRIGEAYLRVVSRQPNDRETQRVEDLHARLSKLFQENPKAASALVDGLDLKGRSSQEAATWITVARTLLNLDEVITRE